MQTLAGAHASDYLKKRFKAAIQISKIHVSLDADIHLKEVIIKDHHGNELIYVDDLATSLVSLTSLFFNELKFGHVAVNQLDLNIKTYKGEQQNSLTIFVNKFKQKRQNPKKSKFFMTIPSLSVENGNVLIKNENQKDGSTLFYKNVCGNVEGFAINESFIIASAKNVSFVENFGLKVQRLDTKFSYSKNKMAFERTKLITENSDIQGDISFLYTNNNFSDFLNKVQIRSKIRNSKVGFKDLNKFYDDFNPEKSMLVSGNFSGILNDLKVNNLSLKNSNNTNVKGNLHLKNAFNPNQKFQLKSSFSQLDSNYEELAVLLPLSAKDKLPKIIQKLGNFSSSGRTLISEKEIDAKLALVSEIGNTNLDLKLKNGKQIDAMAYEGNIQMIDFEIGKLINRKNFKKVSLKAAISGAGLTLDALNTKIEGKISKLLYKNYEYNNIAINGLVKNQLFNGYLEVNDDNIKFDFKGIADFSSESYTYKFKSTVDYCDLKAIKLLNRREASKFKGEVEIDLKGTDLDNINGNVSFKDLFYTNKTQDYFFKDFNLTSLTRENGSRMISVDSPEIIKGSIRGKFKLKQISKLIQNALGSIYSNYEPIEVDRGQKISFNLKIQDKIIELMFPEVELSPKTAINGSLNSDDQSIKLWLRSPKIIAYNRLIEDIDLQIDNKNPVYNTMLKVESLSSEKLNISKFRLGNITVNDTLQFRTTFKSGKMQQDHFDLSFFYTINKNRKSVAGLKKSIFSYRDNTWFTNPTKSNQNKVIYDPEKQHFKIKPFLLSSGRQKLAFFGTIAQNKSKNLTFNFTDLDLEKITQNVENQNFKGKINGSFTYIEEGDTPKPSADIVLSDFYINNSLQGDLSLKLIGDNSLKKYDINALLTRDGMQTFVAFGKIDFTPRKPRLNVALNFDQFKLNVLSPLGGNVFSDIRGEVFGDVILAGLLENPTMSGDLILQDAGMYFPYINVDYQINEKTVVELSNQNFNFKEMKIQDTKKNTLGTLKGFLSYKKFKNWFLDVAIDSDNLLVLNTEQEEDSAFYGTAFLNGKAQIAGPFNKLKIDVEGSTNEDTYFAVPLSDVKTAEETQLIRFVSKDESENEKLRKDFIAKKSSGLEMNFNIDINNNAIFEMVLDQTTGSNLKGSGTGNVQIALDTKDKFEMYGDVLLDKGIYNFKYGGFINKPFDAKKGGSISWSGDPFTAIIDIEAVHRVSANPRTLLENINTTRRVPVNLITRFSGELFNSERKFDIEIPNISNDLASELEFIIRENDENAKTRHFVSLLASGAFYDEKNLDINTTSLVYGTASDIFANAFDQIFNQSGNKLKLRPEYTHGEANAENTDEAEGQFSLGLDYQMNDRILINGKVGVPVGDNNEQSNVIGEVTVDFLLNKDGNLRSSVFNRQNEIQYNNEEEGYTQGIGLSYQIDFSNGKELLRKVKGNRRKRNRKKDQTSLNNDKN